MNQFLASPFLRRFHLLPIFLLVVAGFAISWPLWALGFPLQTDDAKVHIVWYQGFAEQFWSGELYPRWLPKSNAGLGSPAFFYYPPLASWMTCLINVFDRSGDATLAVGRSAAFALIASGCAMYAWLQTLAPRRFAALAALVFMIGPYRISTDIYLRGAFAEHWAFVWLPLILLATQNLARDNNRLCTYRLRAWCALSFFYALLWLTHPPTAVIFAPVVFVYAFISSVNASDATTSTRCRVVDLLAIGAAIVLSLALAAIYLWPALRMENLVWMEEMRSGVFYYQRAFITLATARYGLRLHAISLVLLLLNVAGCWAISSVSNHRKQLDAARFRRMRFWFGVAVVASLMTMTLAAPLYVTSSFLQRIQFPYRWLGVVSIAVAPLFCDAMMLRSQLATRRIEHTKWARALSSLASIMIGGSSLLGILLQVIYVRKSYPQWTPKPAITKYLDWYIENRADMPGHRPRNAQTLTADAPALYRSFGVGTPNYSFAKIIVGDESKTRAIKLRVVERTPRRVTIDIENSQATIFVIEVRQFAFGSWRALAKGKNLRVFPSVPEGLIEIEVPPQVRRVRLELAESSSEKWGKNISAAALFCWIMLSLFLWRRRQKT